MSTVSVAAAEALHVNVTSAGFVPKPERFTTAVVASIGFAQVTGILTAPAASA